MRKTHVAHVSGVHIGADPVGSGFSLLEVIPPCIQSLVQLPETGLQLAWLTCTKSTSRST